MEAWYPFLALVAAFMAGWWLGRYRLLTSMRDMPVTDKQLAYISRLSRNLDEEPPEVFTRARATLVIDSLKRRQKKVVWDEDIDY